MLYFAFKCLLIHDYSYIHESTEAEKDPERETKAHRRDGWLQVTARGQGRADLNSGQPDRRGQLLPRPRPKADLTPRALARGRTLKEESPGRERGRCERSESGRDKLPSAPLPPEGNPRNTQIRVRGKGTLVGLLGVAPRRPSGHGLHHSSQHWLLSGGLASLLTHVHKGTAVPVPWSRCINRDTVFPSL